MRPIPPRYNPGRPLPRQGVQQPRPGIPFQGFPIPRDPGYGSGPRGPIFLPRPDGTLQNMHPAAGGIRPPINISSANSTPAFNSTPVGVRGGLGPRPNNLGPMQGVGDPRLGAATIPGNKLQMQMRGPQQTPMQQFSYGGRAGYQMGGGIMGLENGQEESIFPRIENLSQNLGQAEQTLGQPSDQFNASSITTAITGRPQMNIGGRIGYPRTGIGSLSNRQGYFFGGIGDIVGDIGDLAGDVFGGIGDIGGDIIGSVGDVLGDLDLGELMQIYQVAAPFVGLPPMPGGEFASFLPGSVPGGEGGIGSLGNILGSFMPQEGGGGGGFNPFDFGANLISNYFPNEDDPNNEGRGRPSMDTVSIITDLLRKFLTPEGIAGTTATTLGKLTYDEIKRLNDLREKEFAEYKQGKARKRTKYRTAEGREALPGYNVTGVPQTTADIFRAPAMKGGIMNVPMGQIRRNPVGVKEIDYRKSGGFVPPVGVKEKADDIPAMLSNNEFVFTADAVRAAGGGSVNKGAQKMYGLMKQLEGRL